jgi:hybrid cluster-associated redox disulfide protein
MAKKTTNKPAAKPAKKLTKEPAAKSPKITKDMTLGDAVSRYPKTVEVLFRYGMHCIGCHISAYETIEQGALAHGMSQPDIKKMVDEMNKRI